MLSLDTSAIVDELLIEVPTKRNGAQNNGANKEIRGQLAEDDPEQNTDFTLMSLKPSGHFDIFLAGLKLRNQKASGQTKESPINHSNHAQLYSESQLAI